MIQRSERIHRVGNVELCAETFGDRTDPAVLLIMGAMASMVWWPEGLCERLAARGRYVVRYDHRDTGRSTACDPGSPDYSVDDLASDAFGLLDVLGIDQATIAGMSLGGFLGQILALKDPPRVARLVLIASEPLGPGDPSVPGIDTKVLAHHAKGSELDWTDRQAVVEHMVGGWRFLSGSARPFDEKLIRAIASSEVSRARNLRSSVNHALLTGGERWFGRLAEIQQPTVVIHGTDDCVLRFEHGLALAREISGARLVRLEGAGHELHPLDWEAIVDSIAGAVAA
jgi:pimeloyl-ACP methyl ester carboxylesterase